MRWILLGIGALIVVGVYLWSRRHAGDEDEVFVRSDPGLGHPDHDAADPLFAPTPKPAPRRAPDAPAAPLSSAADEPDIESMQRELSSLQQLLKDDADAARATAPRAAPAAVSAPAKPAAPPEEKLLVMYIVAPGGQSFDGEAVTQALQAAGLSYGDMHIYHRYVNGDGGPPVFGVANLVEPGTLEPEALAQAGTPGLTLFLQLPGPVSPLPAFDLFATTAQQLANQLAGELRDKSRSALSRQTLEHLRDEVQQYERRLRLPR